jgi:peptidoglycan-associated lipoprotein
MIYTKHLALLAIAAVLLGACSSTPVTTPAPAPTPVAPVTGPATAAPPAATQRPAPAATVTPVTLPAHLDAKSPISTERSVYFDFDEFAIKNEYTSLIERHGKYLTSSPALAIRVEGHADERGGSEYNLALGQRRAEAVTRAMRIHGVKASQMEAISFGKERPKALGHDEAAWAQNRRVDLQYPRQ